jgi:hypothetical protein
LRFRLPEFRIPDFPLGGLTVAILFAMGLLAAYPDMPYSWVWEAIVAFGAVAWALGAGILSRPRGSASPRETPGLHYVPHHRPSPDFAALIEAITAQGDSNRKEEQREDSGRKLREWLTIGLLLATVYLLNNQVTEMRKVYDPIRAQAESATEQLNRIDRQLTLLEKSSSQTDEQISVNKDLASAARDQAKAARDSIAVAREDTVASSRAWIGPTSALIEAPSIGNNINATVMYTNSGKQPGSGVVSSVNYYIIDGNGILSWPIQSINDGVKSALLLNRCHQDKLLTQITDLLLIICQYLSTKAMLTMV